jgi:hypothetical protein
MVTLRRESGAVGAVRLAKAWIVVLGLALASPVVAGDRALDFPPLPFPPEIEGLHGLSPVFPRGRDSYLSRLHAAAEEIGLPPALADAVALVESGYDANARGADGEVGLMQVLPTTAAMLGHKGSLADLFEPEVIIRLWVVFLVL